MRRKFYKKSNYKNFLDPDEILADSANAMGAIYASEAKIERPIEKFSYTVFLAIIVLGIIYLSARAGFLQLESGADFFAKSQENRFLTRPVFPPRGIIYDRFKKPLVENHPSFGIVFEKNGFLKSKAKLIDVLVELGEILEEPPEYFYEVGFPESNESKRLPASIVIRQDITPDEIVIMASRLNSVPGVQIFENYRRVYKNPYAFSHLLGFLGKVSEDDLKKYPELDQQEIIGKSGIEYMYDDLIRGDGGKKIVEIDAAGKETRFKLVEEPYLGKELQLTIDGDLQTKVYELLDHYTQGSKGASVVIVDPRDGAVRALVSYPGFDSNRFGYSLTSKEFSAILNNSLKPLFNRAIAGEFPSGSTLKPLVAVAALEEKIIDPNKKINDIGYIEIPNPYNPGQVSRFVDWKQGGHGWVNLYDAIANSVNVYFYTIGGGFKDQKGLGIEKLKKYATAFGLGSILGIDIPGEKPGLFPDPEWKKQADKENPIWRIGDTYNTAIGQGGVRATPLQMAMATAAIANGGKLYQPHIYDAVLDPQGNAEKKNEPKLLREGMVSAQSLNDVIKGMRQTVTAGTGRILSGLPVPAAAKTGTAEAGFGQPHAWIIAFAPFENPEIVIVVMVEHAGEGSTVAAPITNEIMQWYFSRNLEKAVEEIIVE